MGWLLLGLILFFGTHSLRLYADGWRTHKLAQWGETPWKLLYSALSLLGLVALIYGYGQVRWETVALWHPPVWTRHLAALLTLPAFVLMTAAYIPGTHLRARLGHPMLLGVKTWAFAHLLSNGTLADLLLFGSFLAWSIVLFAVLRRRDRAQGITRPAVGLTRDGLALVVGLVAWAVFALYLHRLLIGVAPFG